MPQSSPVGNIPVLGDAPNVPADFLTLATNLGLVVVRSFANATARDSAIPSPVNGQLCTVNGVLQQYLSGTGAGWFVMSAGLTTVTQYNFSAASLTTSVTTLASGTIAAVAQYDREIRFDAMLTGSVSGGYANLYVNLAAAQTAGARTALTNNSAIVSHETYLAAGASLAWSITAVMSAGTGSFGANAVFNRAIITARPA